MAQPSVLVLRAPGANCDAETAHAFEVAGAKTERLHVNRLLEQPSLLEAFQILCIPGGFSYGDDVAAGRILGNQLRHHLADCLQSFRSSGKLILGICNGFQILIKSGLLLESDERQGASATLTWNESGKFEDRWVHVETRGSKNVFFAGIESMYLPVAHAEGKFVPRDARVLEELDQHGQLVLRYCGDPATQVASPGGSISYPLNPNGSVADVAGVCDTTGRVCGLMPHPERHIDPTQHPRWTRLKRGSAGDGLRVFENAVGYFA